MLKDTAGKYAQEKGCNCAESTLLAVSEEYCLGMSDGDAAVMGGFGGGLACGLTCGALCGSIAALGKMLLKGPAHSQPDFRPLCAEYVGAFRDAMGAVDCKDLRPVYFETGKGCIRAIEKNAELLEAFIGSHGLAEKK